MKTTVSSKGQLVLPVEFREQDSIQPGQQFDVTRVEAGKYLLQRISSAGSAGITQWLLACPEKDWFQPVESESTADL
jgi:AbrB family looped-hinge helix DNA binding protein